MKDREPSYRWVIVGVWLFIGSFAVGLGAVAVALAFPQLPRERLRPA